MNAATDTSSYRTHVYGDCPRQLPVTPTGPVPVGRLSCGTAGSIDCDQVGYILARGFAQIQRFNVSAG